MADGSTLNLCLWRTINHAVVYAHHRFVPICRRQWAGETRGNFSSTRLLRKPLMPLNARTTPQAAIEAAKYAITFATTFYLPPFLPLALLIRRQFRSAILQCVFC